MEYWSDGLREMKELRGFNSAGILEYWDYGLKAMKTKVLFFPTIPLLHHSMRIA